MFTARLSHRTKVATAVVGVPAVAAGLWLSAAGAGAAQAAAPAAQSVSAVAAQAAPNTDAPVLIKATKYRGKDRILTVGKGGKISLKRSTPTASNGLSTEGTWMGLTKVGSKYQIMSLNDSEEKDAYCLRQKQSGTMDLALCDTKKKNQLFRFKPSGDRFTIHGKWGHLEVYKRTVSYLPAEHAGPAAKFSIVAKKS